MIAPPPRATLLAAGATALQAYNAAAGGMVLSLTAEELLHQARAAAAPQPAHPCVRRERPLGRPLHGP